MPEQLNPYEEQPLIGYDLSLMSQSEMDELSELIEDNLAGDHEIERALRRIRLRYLYITCGVFFLVGFLAFLFAYIELGTEFKFKTWTAPIFFCIGIMTTFSGFGLCLKKIWGMKLALTTSKLLLVFIPFGTVFGFFAMGAILDCEPEFK